MAAAAFCGSGGASGFRPTKVLLLVFTLLSLVHVTESLVEKKHLDILLEYFEDGIEAAAAKKAELEEELHDVISYVETQTAKLHPVLLHLNRVAKSSKLLQDLTNPMKKVLRTKILEIEEDKKKYEQEIQEIWDFIEQQEIDHDEL